MPDQSPSPEATPPAEPDPSASGRESASNPADSGAFTSARAEEPYDRSGVPTFESVREKIESRYGAAIGADELAADTEEGRAVEEQFEARQRAAAERLAQIRESMRTDD
ncbi:hypothetical protein [Mycobacterium asiaticum]|uniref:Phage shock protein A n=1 Tax=Mycobacterium asiaticum TaxID=1790 RepID=A0A1A3KQ85_MYCAS|nr:hypothetical protein [Mycobacterium asiaticum]OBJ87357.1 hypothetical protein A5640_07375 [Mycobacterium asiaticum]